jgi:hypothetical protein
MCLQIWSEKDNIGVQDFVMLEHYKDEGAFTKNLRERFLGAKLIYVRPKTLILSSYMPGSFQALGRSRTGQTYIGNVLVAVNPYEDVGIYSTDYIMMYKSVNLYELPPHMCASPLECWQECEGFSRA